MIIAVVGDKGGTGKTTVALNLLAYYTLNTELECEGVDLDNNSLLGNLVAIRENFGKAPLNVTTMVGDDEQKLKALVPVLEAHTGSKESILVVDTGGFDALITRAVIYAADVVLAPISYKTPELVALRNFIRIVDDVGKNMNTNIKCHLLLSRLHHGDGMVKLKGDLKKRSSTYMAVNAYIERIITDGKLERVECSILGTPMRQAECYSTTLGEGSSVVETGNFDCKNEFNDVAEEVYSIFLEGDTHV